MSLLWFAFTMALLLAMDLVTVQIGGRVDFPDTFLIDVLIATCLGWAFSEDRKGP
jgi:hypothetical protein